MQKTTKLNFDDVKEIVLDESDRGSLLRLEHNRDFSRLQKIVEDYILKLTYNLAAGSTITKELRYEEMDKLAGFTYYWKKIISLTKKEND